jgi:arylsulfatase A-like enzyme
MYDPEEVDVPPQDCLDRKPENQRVARTLMGMDNVTEEELRKAIALWYGMQNYIDDSLGRVLDAIERLGLRENTIVLYTSDHGEFMGEHSMVHKMNCLYDSIIRVPLVVSWPGNVNAGNTCPHLVELVDVMPTLLDLARIDLPFGVQGRSLVAYLGGGTYDPRRFAVSESGEAGPLLRESDLTWRPSDPFDDRFFPADAFAEVWFGRCKMVRTHEWKLNLYEWGEGELYHLAADPWELNNLFDDPAYQDRITEMKLMLLDWCLEMEDKTPKNVTVGFWMDTFSDNQEGRAK